MGGEITLICLGIKTYMYVYAPLFYNSLFMQATNLCFMDGYGNPRLFMDEAGYYLTTLEAAANYIERLKPEELRQPQV